MYEELLKQDLKELEEKEKLEEAIKRKKYFENQNLRIKNNNQRSDDQKLEEALSHLHDFTTPYQAAVDRKTPLFAER